MLLVKRCSVLPRGEAVRLFPNIQEEADTCTLIILHCLNIGMSLPHASIFIVTSKITIHTCISSTGTILQVYTLDSFICRCCGQQNAS